MPEVRLRIQFHHGVGEKTGEAGWAVCPQTHIPSIASPCFLFSLLASCDTPMLALPSKPISGIVKLIIAADCPQPVRTQHRVPIFHLIQPRDSTGLSGSQGQVGRIRVKHTGPRVTNTTILCTFRNDVPPVLGEGKN